jgi:hypothetical protein
VRVREKSHQPVRTVDDFFLTQGDAQKENNMDRRKFMKVTGTGALVLVAEPALGYRHGRVQPELMAEHGERYFGMGLKDLGNAIFRAMHDLGTTEAVEAPGGHISP